ncbi:MAG: 2-oxoacid:ferredoxin oxidoreductase subunit beta [Leptolyngbya sp. PLA3]|nr:MAG: 2-oxoacid:ferredoxin oxidoreductase subunit beta [Cyanobacteria bacterium CYA]MCE7967843.1 2-oxoacid:ferredoxin oxidoreductase subunit beta [Leptolyngbya sp. PL-A3]
MTTATSDIPLPSYTPKDFASDQDVRWCPGCGDYAVLTGVRKALAGLGISKEKFVFISGIGCAARFPYYMNTYGLHTIHGRAPAVATGVKLANPDLHVFVVSGDGDLLSIGGNHTLHTIRRNVDMTIILLNNRIYGLTKGQYSPTSEVGKVTKSTPMGSLDFPINPLAVAAAAGCQFIARTLDVDVKMLEMLIVRAVAHKGTSIIEVYQDCNIFNHGTFFYASQKETREANTITLEHGKPMVFGPGRNRGIRIRSGTLEAVTLGDGVDESDLLVHDETDPSLVFLLAQMAHPALPEPMGVLHARKGAATYDQSVMDQIALATTKATAKGDTLEHLLHGDETWVVD